MPVQAACWASGVKAAVAVVLSRGAGPGAAPGFGVLLWGPCARHEAWAVLGTEAWSPAAGRCQQLPLPQPLLGARRFSLNC